MPATTSNLYTDIDIYGLEEKPGVAVEYYDQEAISNSVKLWLTSKKGDFIRTPSTGGLLDKYLFKNMTDENLFKIKIEIVSEFDNYFSGVLAIQDIEFNPDYKNRILEIVVLYYDVRTQKTDSVVAYVNTDFAYKRFEYEDVAYIEENLYNFVRITKPSYSVEKLKYDSEKAVWCWGKFLFINFTYSDPYFSQILAYING